MILFFVFSTVSKQNKNFFDEKRKKNRPVFFSAHGCFFGKEPLQEYICLPNCLKVVLKLSVPRGNLF